MFEFEFDAALLDVEIEQAGVLAVAPIATVNKPLPLKIVVATWRLPRA